MRNAFKYKHGNGLEMSDILRNKTILYEPIAACKLYIINFSMVLVVTFVC